MNVVVYGIKNCDTMKKTFKFLEEKGIEYSFVDYKKQTPDEGLMVRFADKVGFSALINKRGTTYRKLTEEEQSLLENEEGALSLLITKSSMIKRPIIEFPDESILLGFEPEQITGKLQKLS